MKNLALNKKKERAFLSHEVLTFSYVVFPTHYNKVMGLRVRQLVMAFPAHYK